MAAPHDDGATMAGVVVVGVAGAAASRSPRARSAGGTGRRTRAPRASPRQPALASTPLRRRSSEGSAYVDADDLDTVIVSPARGPRAQGQKRKRTPSALLRDFIDGSAASIATEHKKEKEAKKARLPPCSDPTKYCGFCCKMDVPRNLITCSQCGNSGHPTECMQLPKALADTIRRNPEWVCIECKICSICQIAGDDHKLLFCDACDCGVHMTCLDPPVKSMPRGDFFCPACAPDGPFKRTRAPRQPAPPQSHKKAKSKPRRGRPPKSASKKAGSKHRRPSTASDAGDAGPGGSVGPSRRLSKSKGSSGKQRVRPLPLPDSLFFKKATADSVDQTADDPDGIPRDSVELFEQARRDAMSAEEAAAAGPQAQSPKKLIQIGPYEIETWYSAPYPEEYMRVPTIYLCEYCLKYMKSAEMLRRHTDKCESNGHPPGQEIYREGRFQFWEVDGNKNKIYCQNLCLLAKLFLDHKTLYYDVEPFMFYILTERDDNGTHLLGYFSKEKNSTLSYNVSCILTMPYAMRKGFGRVLIDFSYLLTRREKKTGAPEKPLSQLGALSYASYWKGAVLSFLAKRTEPTASIYDITRGTAMCPEDVIKALTDLGFLQLFHDQHLLVIDPAVVEAHRAKSKQRQAIQLDDAKLKWIPVSARPAWA